MRRILSLASLLLVAAGVARGVDPVHPEPYIADEALRNFMVGEADEQVTPYIVGGQVSESIGRSVGGTARVPLLRLDGPSCTHTHPLPFPQECRAGAIPLHIVHDL